MARSTDLASDGTHLVWRRPHPVTIVFEIGRAVRSTIIALAIVRGGLLTRSSLLEFALIAAPLLAGLARWFTTRYAIDSESIHHHHGLLWRKKQVLPRSNVQNISTKAGILARAASMVELQVSDASATGDINLRYLTQTEADRLAILLRSSAPATAFTGPASHNPGLDASPQPTAPQPTALQPTAPQPTAPQPTAPQPTAPATAAPPSGPSVELDKAIVSPTLSELFKSELTTIWIFATLCCSVTALGVIAALLIAGPLDGPSFAGGRSLLAAATTFLVTSLALAGVAVATRLVGLGGYRLVAEPDRLRIQVGLLTEARVAARRERMQQIRVERQILHRMVGIERITFETADLEIAGSAGARYLSPVGPTDGWRAIAAEVFDEVQLDESDLQSVSPLTVRRTVVRFAIAALAMTALALVHLALPVPVVVAWMLLGWAYGRARFRQLGWAVSTDQYLLRSGVFFGRLTLVHLDKIQSLNLDASYFQRQLGLATVRVSTAGSGIGGVVRLPDLPRAQAEQLLAELSHRAATTAIAETL